MIPARGSDMHISVQSGESGYLKIAGLRTKAVRLSASVVNITHAESLERWRECAPQAGMKAALISGRGLFHSAASTEFARAAFFEQAVHNYKIDLPNFGSLSGAFLLAELAYLGSYDGEANFELSLTSTGVMRFSPIA